MSKKYWTYCYTFCLGVYLNYPKYPKFFRPKEGCNFNQGNHIPFAHYDFLDLGRF